jgi:hypothetical protein
MLGFVSTCCGAPVLINSSGGGSTHWNECSQCGNPCDAVTRPQSGGDCPQDAEVPREP